MLNSGVPLTLQDSMVGAAMQATNAGGGIYNHSSGTVTVDGSRVSANTAGDGAGIYNSGTLWLQNGSTIGGSGTGNQATTYGGGIYNEGTTTVTGSRILHNTVSNLGGGGVYNDAGAVRATVTGGCTVGNSDIAFVSEQAARQTATGNWWGASDRTKHARRGHGQWRCGHQRLPDPAYSRLRLLPMPAAGAK
jgi:hypothetical protein